MEIDEGRRSMKRFYPGILLLLLGALPVAALQAPPARAPAKPAPSPTPPPVLEGTVKGPDGKPVEGAVVMARSSSDYSEGLLSARTDASGRFRLPVKRAAPYTVRVEAKGLAGRTVDKARPGTPLDITLTRGAVLEGTVRDGVTGQPVPQARVEARQEMTLSLPWEPTAGVAQAVTDAKGHFRLEGLGNGPQAVSARVTGGDSGRKNGALPGRPADIYLFPGATLSGTVWGPGNLRVSGAVVRAEVDSPGFRTAPPPAVSDDQGRYEMVGVEAGSYRLVARHKDFAPELVAGVTVERGGDAHADINLDKGTSVIGRLVAGPEQTVPGRVTIQEIDGQAVPWTLGEILRAEAAADGRFRLEMLPSGAHVLGVKAPGYSSKRVDVNVPSGGRDVDVGDVELETGLAIRGRVRDASGRPISGANIIGQQARSMPAPYPTPALSETDGSFVLAGLQPGSYRVSVTAQGYAGADRPIEAGAEKVDLVLSPAGSISGAVVDDTGRPVESFRVNASPARREADAPGTMIMGPRNKIGNGTDGRFLIEDLAEGTYVVAASAPGQSSANVSGVKVSAGSTTDAGTIRLSAGGTVRGMVADAAGTPVAGAVITVRGPGRDYGSIGASPQGVSDPAGAFEVTGVPPATVEVSASHPNYAEGRVSGIDVDPAKGPAEARIVLSQGGRIEGVVRRRDGTAIGGAYVNVTPQRRGGGFSYGGPGILVTTADGGFVAEHIPAGRVTVTLMTRSGNSYTSAQSNDVDVREGETTPVELRSRDIILSGHVTRAGAPLPDVRITIRGERTMMMSFVGPADVPVPGAGPERMTAVTGEDGGYEMIVSQSGRAYVEIERLDGKGSYPGRTADIPDADAYTLDLTFAGATLSGVVVDRETEQPVPRARVFAVPKKPDPSRPGVSGGETGEDGRFQLDVEPGDYRVSVFAESYARVEAETSVASGGASDIRLALVRGLTLQGKVVDGRGNGVGGLSIAAMALGADGRPAGGGGAMSLPDGSFQISGLQSVPHRLIARSDVGMFGLREGVRPGDKDVVLTLRRGGRVTIRVLGTDGQPVAGAFATVDAAGIGTTTDAHGTAELTVPAGTVELRLRKDRLEGRTTVTMAEGGTAAVEIALAPPPRAANP
jgi:protocatechuate 3,4-dioxygenase beta subunit